MAIELGTMQAATVEHALIAKMETALEMRDRLRQLAMRASSQGFFRTRALIDGALAALDDELASNTQIRVRPRPDLGA